MYILCVWSRVYIEMRRQVGDYYNKIKEPTSFSLEVDLLKNRIYTMSLSL